MLEWCKQIVVTLSRFHHLGSFSSVCKLEPFRALVEPSAIGRPLSARAFSVMEDALGLSSSLSKSCVFRAWEFLFLPHLHIDAWAQCVISVSLFLVGISPCSTLHFLHHHFLRSTVSSCCLITQCFRYSISELSKFAFLLSHFLSEMGIS